MTIIDEPLLKTYRTPGPCWVCGKPCLVREPAHVEPRRSGGATRLDIAINLVAVGSTPMFQCSCHANHHNRKAPTRGDLLMILADRQDTTPQAIEGVLGFLLRLDKYASPELIEHGFKGMRPETAKLARRVWPEIRESKPKRKNRGMA